jgi:hypothetical protein
MLDVYEILRIARSCEIRNPGLRGLRLHTLIEGMDLRIVVSHDPPDRDTGERIRVARSKRLGIREINLYGPDWLIERIAHEVEELFLHEFRECFHVGGHRYRDPHANDPPESNATAPSVPLPQLETNGTR